MPTKQDGAERYVHSGVTIKHKEKWLIAGERGKYLIFRRVTDGEQFLLRLAFGGEYLAIIFVKLMM